MKRPSQARRCCSGDEVLFRTRAPRWLAGHRIQIRRVDRGAEDSRLLLCRIEGAKEWECCSRRNSMCGSCDAFYVMASTEHTAPRIASAAYSIADQATSPSPALSHTPIHSLPHTYYTTYDTPTPTSHASSELRLAWLAATTSPWWLSLPVNTSNNHDQHVSRVPPLFHLTRSVCYGTGNPPLTVCQTL